MIEGIKIIPVLHGNALKSIIYNAINFNMVSNVTILYRLSIDLFYFLKHEKSTKWAIQKMEYSLRYSATCFI